MRELAESLLQYETTAGEEATAQAWLRKQLDALGFETNEWTADAATLSVHPSFPDDPDAIAVDDRPSVAGVIELGEPDAGPTLVLNGHVDVVPTTDRHWESSPFVPTWDDDRVTARGAADMKAGLVACVFAATRLADTADVDGRIVVESVAGEEDGGIGAAAAALSNPYPFDRDAAIVAEPTDLRLVTATEGSLMLRIGIEGRSAHAATRWRGESVLPHLEAIRDALADLECERATQITHPLYDRFEIPWPISIGRVEAGTWASSVAASLTAKCRIGVAPGETVAAVEREVQETIATVAANDAWLSEHPPTIERFGIQFEPATVDHDATVVAAIDDAMAANGLSATPQGVTYGADSRHYEAAGIPTVLFGPGSIDRAHFPNESIDWQEVERARDVIADAAANFLATRTARSA